MTTDELNTIVAAVVAELEKSGVDFDYKIEAPLDTDTIFVIRGTAPDYQGKVITWKGLLDIITAKAEQAKKDAVEAQKKAETSEANASNSETNVSNMKSAIEQMQLNVTNMKNTVVEAKRSVTASAASVSKSESTIQGYAEQVASDKEATVQAKKEAVTAKDESVTAQGKAETARDEAIQAKNTANTILTQVQSKGTEITNFVATSKTEIETQKNESVEEVRTVYQSDLNELKGDLDTERNARMEADTDHSTRLQNVEFASSVNRYEIDNLKAKAEGKLYRTETVEAEAYALDVPSSVAPYAEVQKIGGKSVVWNQLNYNYLPTSKDKYSVDRGTLTYDSNEGCLVHTFGQEITDSYNMRIKIYGGIFIPNVTDKFYVKIFVYCPKQTKFSPENGESDIIIKTVNKNVWTPLEYISSNKNIAGIVSPKALSAGYVEGDQIKYKWISKINLTLMFGSGNEPTLEECKKIFSENYYPYDAGTLKSFPVKRVVSRGKNIFNGYKEVGWIVASTGQNVVRKASRRSDYIPLSQGTYTFSLTEYTLYLSITFYDSNKLFIKGYEANYSNTLIKSVTAPDGTKYMRISLFDYTKTNLLQIEKGSTATDYVPYREPIEYDVSSITTDLKSALNAHDEWQNGKITRNVGERAYTEGDESDSSLITDGTTTYYPLDTPTEETVPEIDNYINVEGGGTLTFESDETVYMPVPSTDRFIVDLTSTTEETT